MLVFGKCQLGYFPQLCVRTAALGDDLISAASSNPFDFLIQHRFFKGPIFELTGVQALSQISGLLGYP